MALFALGLNYKTAPVSVREKIAFDEPALLALLNTLSQQFHIDELVILSTCNRTEFYCYHENSSDSLHKLKQWLVNEYEIEEDLFYLHQSEHAVKHIMSVACGLDSMVLGEHQILGQLKKAVSFSKSSNTLGSYLDVLFQFVFAVAKEVRSDTDIGAQPISLAYTAVSLAKSIFADVSSQRALLIGAGDTIELCARHLIEQGVQHITIANRTLSRARNLAKLLFDNGKTNLLHIDCINLSQIPNILSQTDIVFTSTASPLPILGKGLVENVIRQRKHQPQLMIDLAVPRDIEVGVNDIEDVYLYSVDDLETVIDNNKSKRKLAAEDAYYIIQKRCDEFFVKVRLLSISQLIQAFRSQHEDISQRALKTAKNQLRRGQRPEDVLDSLTHTLVRKFMHTPCVQLKEAQAQKLFHVVEDFKFLFKLDKE